MTILSQEVQRVQLPLSTKHSLIFLHKYEDFVTENAETVEIVGCTQGLYEVDDRVACYLGLLLILQQVFRFFPQGRQVGKLVVSHEI
jgi:hypothetical protein